MNKTRILQIEENFLKERNLPRSDILYSYTNGNHQTILLKNGTRYRETLDPKVARLSFSYGESCEVKITNCCDAGCKFCHEDSTVNGEHAELFNKNGTLLQIFSTLKPGIEISIEGGNVLTHPDLLKFLTELKKRGAVCNITVNQVHLTRYEKFIRALIRNELIFGLGISLKDSSNIKDMRVIKELEDLSCRVYGSNNVVIKVIAGLLTQKDLNALKRKKVLILGYKDNTGRAISYSKDHFADIRKNQLWLKENLNQLSRWFAVMSFDKLALTQLNTENRPSLIDTEWYLRCAFYFDAVNKMIGTHAYTGQTFEESYRLSLK